MASPALYQAYHIARQEILPCLLHRQYNGLVDIHEAIAAIRSKKLHYAEPLHQEKIIALLDGRRRSDEIRRLNPQTRTAQPFPHSRPLPDQPTDVDEVLKLMKLHRMAVWFLDDYSRNARCPYWTNEDKWTADILPLEFTALEKKRYFRAFYRLQTYCNMFGNRPHPIDSPDFGPASSWDLGNEREQIWKLFFAAFAPWEVEEFACLWQHFHDRHAKVYYEVADDLAQYGRTELKDLPEHLHFLPSAAFEVDANTLSIGAIFVREGLTSLGPTWLFNLLHAKDYITRRNMILANTDRSYDVWPLDRPPSTSAALELIYPADRFDFGTDVCGLQAFLSTVPDIQRPNLSWTKTWLERLEDNEPLYEEMFETSSRARRWEWAYAFWSDERLSEWETKFGAPLRDTT